MEVQARLLFREPRCKNCICVDEAPLEFVSIVAIANDFSDAEGLPDLLQDALRKIEQVSADGVYDRRRCYDTLKKPDANLTKQYRVECIN